METRLSAPAPKDKAIGRIPRIVESEVIKIGLNRDLEAPRTASLTLKPWAFR